MINLGEKTRLLREKGVLVHHITNMVSMNDSANICLAIGASPIMALDINEVEEIVLQADSLLLNMGTFSQERKEAMIRAGRAANKKGIPVVLDPVGISASSFRRESLEEILEKVKVDIVKANPDEIKALAGLETRGRGVDSDPIYDLRFMEDLVKQLAEERDFILAMTGERDLISDGKRLKRLDGGSSYLKKLTGTGCMTGSLIASYAAVYDSYTAAILGIKAMGWSGERAASSLLDEDSGLGSFKIYLFDEISKI